MGDEKRSFEEKYNRLNEIVSKLEGESLPLEESMSLYEEGKKLISELDSELKQAEEKIGDLSVKEEEVK